MTRWAGLIRGITGLALLLAIPSIWPYAYYQLLRWLVFIVAGYSAYLSFQENKQSYGWIMVIVAVLFNPIAPIYLSKTIWSILDVVTALVFFISIYLVRKTI